MRAGRSVPSGVCPACPQADVRATPVRIPCAAAGRRRCRCPGSRSPSGGLRCALHRRRCRDRCRAMPAIDRRIRRRTVCCFRACVGRAPGRRSGCVPSTIPAAAVSGRAAGLCTACNGAPRSSMPAGIFALRLPSFKDSGFESRRARCARRIVYSERAAACSILRQFFSALAIVPARSFWNALKISSFRNTYSLPSCTAA